ncbi:MAG: zinc ribbon domain-containing protein [Coriobacteriales bacterium]|nr:zinc ribbon domain-containing protein [Coriobacteriales bacterium]
MSSYYGSTNNIDVLRERIEELSRIRTGFAAHLGASLYQATKDNPDLRWGRESLYDGIATCDSERERMLRRIEELTSAAGDSAGTDAQAESAYARPSSLDKTIIVEEPVAVQATEELPVLDPTTVMPVIAPIEQTMENEPEQSEDELAASEADLDAEPAIEPEPEPDPEPEPEPELEREPESAPDPMDAIEHTPVMPEPMVIPAPEPMQTPAMGNPVCPKCGCAVNPGDKFCMECGSPLPTAPKKTCPTCGSPVDPSHQFCMICGQKLK